VLPPHADVQGWAQRVRHATVAQLDDVRVVGSVGVIVQEPGTRGFSVEEMLDCADKAMDKVEDATAATRTT
jgi:GGDEF domain-containing protein